MEMLPRRRAPLLRPSPAPVLGPGEGVVAELALSPAAETAGAVARECCA